MEKVQFEKGKLFSVKPILNVNAMVKMAFLSVIAYILMIIEIPVMFFPAFLTIDLSDIPALIAGFALGPIGGIIVEFIKNILHLITKSSTGGVGELANFLVGSALVVPAAIAYKVSRTRRSAFMGMALGVAVMGIVGALANYFIILPFYSKVMPLEQIIAWSSAANGAIKDMKTLILYAVIPFNILKGTIVVIITGIIYKKISPLLIGRH